MDDYEIVCREAKKIRDNARESEFVLFAKSDKVEIVVKETLVDKYKYLYEFITPLLLKLNSKYEVRKALEFSKSWENLKVVKSLNDYQFTFTMYEEIINVDATYIVTFKDGSQIFHDYFLGNLDLFYRNKNKAYALFYQRFAIKTKRN